MEVRLPRLGEGADSGTEASVFVKVGDRIAIDQAIFELESEKAVATIPSPVAGSVEKVHVKEGDTVKVGQLILSVEEGGASAVQPSRVVDMRVGDEEDQPSVMSPPVGPDVYVAPGKAAGPLPPGIPPAAAPTVRRVARELGIDLTRIRGSERGGRIIMADLRGYIQQLQSGGTQVSALVPPAHGATPPASIVTAIVTRSFWHGSRFSSQRRFINGCIPFHDHSICGDHLSFTHLKPVSLSQLLDAHISPPFVPGGKEPDLGWPDREKMIEIFLYPGFSP